MICPKCHGNGYWIEQMRAGYEVEETEDPVTYSWNRDEGDVRIERAAA